MKSYYIVTWYDELDHRQEAQYFAESESEVSDAFYYEHIMGEAEDGSDLDIDYEIYEMEV